jgi:hypothetical protein
MQRSSRSGPRCSRLDPNWDRETRLLPGRRAPDDCGPYWVAFYEEEPFTRHDEDPGTLGLVSRQDADGSTRWTHWDFHEACASARERSADEHRTHLVHYANTRVATFAEGVFLELRPGVWQPADVLANIEWARSYRRPDFSTDAALRSHLRAAVWGASQACHFLAWNVALWIGGGWLLVLVGTYASMRTGWEGHFDYARWVQLGFKVAIPTALCWFGGWLLAASVSRQGEYLGDTAEQWSRLLAPMAGLRELFHRTDSGAGDEAWGRIPPTAVASYAEYLRSPGWKARRKLALSAARHRCQVCNGKRKLQVHHRTYERIGRERPDDLVVLCNACHALFHDGGRMPVR